MRILVFICVILAVFVNNAKGEEPLFAIKLNNSAPVQFCTDPVVVAKDLTIEGTPNIRGMKISLSGGYMVGEDELIYTGTLSQSQPAPGTLELTGSTNVQDYIDAIRSISYKNSKAIPTLGIRKITISLNDVDYLPETGHFYRYVPGVGISWTNAKTQAESNAMMYYGLRGYLATITSQVENEFIKSKTKGVGWIGASDAGVEGVWRWVTGPEGLEDGLKGRLFWNGKGIDYRNNVPGTGPYLGRYNNWNTDEPNENGNNEDYAHILFFANNPGASLKWNDLPNIGGNGEYSSKGYLIEFGGLPGEPVLELSATLDLQVNTMLFKTGTIAPICEGDSVILNQADINIVPASYSWSPAGALVNPSIPNPVAFPVSTTKYTVTGTRGTCNSSESFIVPVNPKPVSLLKAEENICKGNTINLDPGVHQVYYWSNNATTQTITVGTTGSYSVKLTSDKGCTITSASKVVVHEYPTIDLSQLQTLICGDAKATIVDITTNASDFSLVSTDSRANVHELNVDVPAFGIYPMVYTAIHLYCPVEKKFELAFYKTPKIGLNIDDQTCSGYNLNVNYKGDADTIVSNFKWEFGGEILANETGLNSLVVPLGINRSQRVLTLTVTQDGCSDSVTQTGIKVIPKLDLSIVDNLGCEPFNAEFIADNTEVVVYDWDFGDGTPVERKDNHPFHPYQSAGFYDVKLKVTTIVPNGEGCTNEVKIDKMVHVVPIPDVTFSLSPENCLNPGVNEISYSGLIGTDRDKYIWDLNNIDPSEVITNPFETKGPLVFDLKTQPNALLGLKVVSEFGCESLPGSFMLKRMPDFSMNASGIAGCIPFEPLLSGIIKDMVDKVDFTWDFGDGSTGTGSPVTHTYHQPDKSYNITLSGTSSVTGCSYVVINNDYLRTNPKPKAAFSMDNQIVYNDKPTVNFTNLSTGAGANTYLWDFGDGLTSDQKDPSHYFKVTGYRTVLLEAVNEFLCSDTITHQILVAFNRIFPPNGFSPNAQNPIDREFLLNSEGIISEGYHFTVLSRWNDIVFETKDEIKGWDGRMNNGSLAPAGAYVWILNFTDFLGRKHRQNGTVSLVY